MDPVLASIAADQGGVFRRSQALQSGYSPRAFRTLCAPGGEFVRVRYGAFAVRETFERLSEVQRAVLRVRGAMLFCDPDATASHSSAGRSYELPVYGVTDDLDHLTRDGPTHGRRKESGVVHHVAELWPPDIVDVNGTSTTSRERTAIDFAREYGYASGLVFADAALALGASKQRMLELADLTRHWPRSTTIRAVANDADGGSESPGETLMRPPLMLAGIGPIRLQHVFQFDGWSARVDAYAPLVDHIFEFDGWMKYDPALNGGIDPNTVLQREKRRENWLRGMGMGLTRFEWYEVQPDRWQLTVARIRREVAEQSRPRRRPVYRPA